jgi:hypothetical protein
MIDRSPRFNLCKSKCLLAASLASFLLTSCTTYDNKNRIAAAVLSTPDGQLDEVTLTAALNARFAQGTKSDALARFVTAQDGRCAVLEDGEMSCTLWESGSFCFASKIGLIAKLNQNGTIHSINAKRYLTGC